MVAATCRRRGSLNQSVARGESGGLAAIRGVEFAQDIGHVIGGGAGTEEEPLGDFRVGEMLAEEREHLPLAGSQAEG